MKEFRTVAPESIRDNTFTLIGSDWMLITAGTGKSFNTMTASWGAMGILWNKPVCFCTVRPTRYTFGFLERAAVFTLSFFNERYRKVLNFCGSHSGRDIDKVAQAGVTPVDTPSGGVAFQEARLIVECRKIYWQDISPQNFLDPALDGNYPDKDYHRMYVGEILHCLEKQERP
jgi:flavin reductase (DIM6/NTAB) family NADH-FMN oxidoreductase RutF